MHVESFEAITAYDLYQNLHKIYFADLVVRIVMPSFTKPVDNSLFYRHLKNVTENTLNSVEQKSDRTLTNSYCALNVSVKFFERFFTCRRSFVLLWLSPTLTITIC